MGSAPRETIRVADGPGRVRMDLAGTVGAADACRLHRIAVELAARAVDVDVQADSLEHVDTASLQVLLAFRRAVAAGGKELRCHGLGDAVAGHLRRSGLEAALGGIA